MRQGTKRDGEIIEALLQQFAGQGVNHLPLQPDLNRRFPILLTVLGVDRGDGMDQFMHQDAENLFRLRQVRANENFEMLIGGR